MQATEIRLLGGTEQGVKGTSGGQQTTFSKSPIGKTEPQIKKRKKWKKQRQGRGQKKTFLRVYDNSH